MTMKNYFYTELTNKNDMRISVLFFLLFAFGFSHAQESQKSVQEKPAQTANQILGKACQQANLETKNVLLIFHASWCGWCRRMEENMENPLVKDYFDQNFVKVFLTVQETPKNKNLETPGGEEVLDWFGGKKQGLPYWLILNSDGEILADSKVNGENLGCPADEKEVAAMISKFENHSPNQPLNPNEIKEVFVMKQ